MNENQIQAAQVKRIRRNILDALNMAYPGTLSFEDLCTVLPTVESHYLHRDVAYLVEKGYVRWINQQRNASMRDGEFRLTAAGTEIAQKINTDPAISP